MRENPNSQGPNVNLVKLQTKAFIKKYTLPLFKTSCNVSFSPTSCCKVPVVPNESRRRRGREVTLLNTRHGLGRSETKIPELEMNIDYAGGADTIRTLSIVVVSTPYVRIHRMSKNRVGMLMRVR
jgi:hypothetical protein